jgi:hypothetical protein
MSSPAASAISSSGTQMPSLRGRAHRIVRVNRGVWFGPRRRATMCVVADGGVAVESAASGVRRWLVPRPGLFELLGRAERVVHVSAPARSGKTFLLRSWITAEGLGERVAWVSVGRGERDGQAFWLSVLDSLRGTRVGSERVRELTAAPDLDGAMAVRRLLEDGGSLDERLWLVIDDLHELKAEEAIRQVELLLGAAPPQLRLVLLTRRDLRLGLHRLRVEGELTEIRGEECRGAPSSRSGRRLRRRQRPSSRSPPRCLPLGPVGDWRAGAPPPRSAPSRRRRRRPRTTPNAAEPTASGRATRRSSGPRMSRRSRWPYG